MSLFKNINKAGNMLNKSAKAVGQAAGAMARGGAKAFTFTALPMTQAEFTSLPQAQMQDPYETAAMFVLALNAYVRDQAEAVAMMNFLKGPSPMSGRELQALKTELGQAGKGAHLAQSYLAGATPQNDYMPTQPYTVNVSDNPYSYDNAGYAKLYVSCGGADTPRPITLRQAKEGKWYLWEQFLLTGIRKAESSNPWA